jgi:REP element-mobilizing transposase RayT
MDRRISAERSVSTALQDAPFIPLSLRSFQMHCRDHGSAPIRVNCTRLHSCIRWSARVVPEIRKRYWGRRFWARGYFCTTSGNVTDDINFIQYIQSHSDKFTDASR